MKKKLFAIALVINLMVCIPLFTVNKPMLFKEQRADTCNENSKICGMVAGLFKEEYSSEALKALCIILKSNYNSKATGDKNYLSKKAFLKKYKSNGKKYYARIVRAVKSVGNKQITYKGKAAYIPCFYSSKGYTKGSKKYPYIKNAASPWDNIKSKHTVGISINGINKLCQKGASYKQALRWYLKDVKIQGSN